MDEAGVAIWGDPPQSPASFSSIKNVWNFKCHNFKKQNKQKLSRSYQKTINMRQGNQEEENNCFQHKWFQELVRDLHSSNQYLFRYRERPLEYPVLTHVSYHHPHSDFKKFRSMKGFVAWHICGPLPHSYFASLFQWWQIHLLESHRGKIRFTGREGLPQPLFGFPFTHFSHLLIELSWSICKCPQGFINSLSFNNTWAVSSYFLLCSLWSIYHKPLRWNVLNDMQWFVSLTYIHLINP